MRTTLLIALSLCLSHRAGAESADAYMRKVFNRSTWKDMQGDVKLTMTTRGGATKERQIEMWSRRNAKDESSMLMRFVKPADVRGTGFLLIEHDKGEDDRRLFLPALRRVQRISTSGSGGNFMSSDFSYYDIGKPKVEDWKFSAGGEKKIGGVKCRVYVGKAASGRVRSDTGYSKVAWYVDPARLIALAADYYDKSGRKLKVMEVKKVELISGVPFATRMVMKDANTGHRSEMVFANLRTNKGVSDSVFTTRNLRRWTR
jgi:hypothetical protein